MDNSKSKKLVYLEKILRTMAVLVLKKYNPKIVGITGSVGKTSAKEAAYAALAGSFRVRRNEKNYNNEIGIPLTIIGAETGERSFWKWLRVFLKWLGIMIFPIEYPEILILEMAADRPGDIRYLAKFIDPKIAIITDISESHLEYFKNVEEISKEKGSLIKNINEKGLAILNIDNERIKKLARQTKVRVMSFGFSPEADICASDIFYNYADLSNSGGRIIRGLSFKLTYKGTTIPMRLNNILARHSIYSALSAVAVGIELGLNLVEIGASLENFCLPYGRMNLIPGIKNSMIIDDTYNASPVSTIAALKVLEEIRAPRKIAVLGDMLELGAEEEAGHREAAREFIKIKNGIILTVGSRMQFMADELKKHGILPERLFVLSNPIDAGRVLQDIIGEGDLILVKGSQGMRMEKVVEEVMAQPQKAPELLCRQNASWKNKPWKEA